MSLLIIFPRLRVPTSKVFLKDIGKIRRGVELDRSGSGYLL